MGVKSTKEAQDRRRSSGLCRFCDLPALPDRTSCAGHARKAREYYTAPAPRAKQLLRAARNRAKYEGVACTLDLAWVEDRIVGTCEMTGLPFQFTPPEIGHFNPYAPSIDRKVGRDYTPDNCRMVVTAMNWAMNRWGEQILRVIVDAWRTRADQEGFVVRK